VYFDIIAATPWPQRRSGSVIHRLKRAIHTCPNPNASMQQCNNPEIQSGLSELDPFVVELYRSG
jgi:hypothetical protein